MNPLIQDLQYSLRSYRRNPGFVLVVLLILGLGIGLNTAIFSAVYGVLLKKLPFPQPQDLVTIWGKLPANGLDPLPVSPPEYQDYREKT
ncbi:ABC transporter permease, partial [bacterium]|nr:ABC transporter permease [bacterium]